MPIWGSRPQALLRQSDSERVTLYERAIACLARREYSRAELARKLAAHAEESEGADAVDTGEAIAAVLDRLEAQNLLSDTRYAEMLGHSRAGRHGSLRLRQDLKQKGVSEQDCAIPLAEAQASDLEHCRSVWQKKFAVLPVDLKDRARQTRFLLSRGFPGRVVAQVLKGAVDEDFAGI